MRIAIVSRPFNCLIWGRRNYRVSSDMERKYLGMYSVVMWFRRFVSLNSRPVNNRSDGWFDIPIARLMQSENDGCEVLGSK